ncbi:Serine/threonine kinase [Rhizina undulata]
MGNSSGKPVVFTDEVNLNHFRLLRVVGKGAFGKVRIVERKDTGLTFALKYIRKDEVHRDVKPDNILLDHEGHVHLADFNVASDVPTDRPLTSKSGTLAYLAAEVYSGAGYGTAVDWWSLGVVFYECIYGRRPFSSDTHESLAKEIMRASPRYAVTNPPVSQNCMHAIRSLIQPDVSKRIGAASFESFTNHQFFADIDFGALERKEIEPVFRPSSDKTNFDATYDLEELLLEEAPLEARARRQRPRERLKEDATPQEIREEELHKMIETLFEPFDYTTVAYDKYPGTVDEVSKSVGPPPDWVRPSMNPPRSDVNNGASPVSITTTQKSQKSMIGSPSSGSPPIPTGKEAILSDQRPPPSPRPVNPNNSSEPPTSFRPPPNRTGTGMRNQSASGGVQVVLDETGSWSDLADKSSTMPSPNNLRSKPSGMLGFLSKRKGRASSPKPQERGVLGREGARVVIA